LEAPGSILNHHCNASANKNTLDDAHVSYSTTKVSLQHPNTFNFLSYIDEKVGVTMLPIEHHPDFANIGAHLKLGEESNSVVSSNTNDDDDIYASSSTSGKEPF
jgi:hypothetical protein